MRHGLEWMCVLGGLLMVGLTEGRAPAPGTARPALDKTTLAEVRKLQEKRRDVLREALFRMARGTLDEVVKTSKLLLEAELDLATTDGERIAAHQRHFEKATVWAEVVEALHKASRAGVGGTLEAQAALLEAEIGLLKAGGKPPKKMKK